MFLNTSLFDWSLAAVGAVTSLLLWKEIKDMGRERDRRETMDAVNRGLIPPTRISKKDS